MGMRLPPELTWLEWVVGTDWPDGDEDALWRMRDAWVSAAQQVREVIEAGDTAYHQVIGGLGGSAADQFTAYWQQFADGDDAYLAKLAKACESLAGHCDSTATEIEYAKYQFIIFLIILACQIAYMLAMAAPTFGASTAGIPVAEVATQSLIRVVAQNVLRSIVTFVLQNVVSDVVIQAVQLGEGHRTHFDASKTVHAAIDGAVSGAIFGVVGTGVHLAGAKFAPHLADSALGRMAEGATTNALGSLATSVATGQPLTLENLTKQATAGAVGSAGHHGAGDHDPADPDDPDRPHEPGDHALDDPALDLPRHVEPLPDLSHDDRLPADRVPDDRGHDDPGARGTTHDGPTRVDPGRPERDEPYRSGSGDHIYDVLAGGSGPDTGHRPPHGTALAGTEAEPARAPSVAVPADVPTPRAPAPAPPAHDNAVIVTDPGGPRPAPPVAAPTPVAGAHSPAAVTDARTPRPDGGVMVAAPVGGHLALDGDVRDRGPRPDDIAWRGEAGRALTVEQNAAAEAFLYRAYANEAMLTPQLREIAGSVDGGRLFGEKDARKGVDSFKRKLADEIAADPLLPMSAHLAEMKDAVRYTVGLPERGYAEGARHVVDALLDHGFEPVKFKNFWGAPDGYRGVNSFWHDPRTGQVFEVQVHTDASFQAKTETHHWYEVERTSTDPVERARVTAAMDERFAQVPVPDGAAHIGLGEHPPHPIDADPHDRSPLDLPGRVTDAEALDLVRGSAHRTPAGYAFYPPGDDLLRFADAVRPRAGVVTLDLHGTVDGFQIGDRVFTGEQFAHAVDVLRREGVLAIGPHDVIRLGACDVARGPDSPAARFAHESGYRVVAPTERLWTNLRGEEIVSSARLRDGRWIPGEPPDGHWRTFDPDREVSVPHQREPLESGADEFRARGPDASISEADQARADRDQARVASDAGGATVADAVRDARTLDELLDLGIRPHEIAAHLDAGTLRRLVPGLAEEHAHDLARLYADPAVRRMLHESWGLPPDRPPVLAEALLHELSGRPELVSVLHDSPELRHSLLSRPMTLHHVAEHEQAVQVLRDVVDELRTRGAEAMLADGVPVPAPTDLMPDQVSSSAAAAAASTGNPRQLGFDPNRRHDPEYLSAYLDRMYEAARPAQHELNALADRIAREIGGEPKYRERPKDRTRAMDKVVKYANRPDRLNDLAAACVILNSVADLYRALDTVRATPGLQLAEFNDRLRSPQDSGYRDVQLSVRTSNGHVAEFRLHLRAIEDVSGWEHSLYEVRRDLDALAQNDGRTPPTERALIDGVLRREQDAFWSALADGPAGQGETS